MNQRWKKNLKTKVTFAQNVAQNVACFLGTSENYTFVKFGAPHVHVHGPMQKFIKFRTKDSQL